MEGSDGDGREGPRSETRRGPEARGRRDEKVYAGQARVRQGRLEEGGGEEEEEAGEKRIVGEDEEKIDRERRKRGRQEEERRECEREREPRIFFFGRPQRNQECPQSNPRGLSTVVDPPPQSGNGHDENNKFWMQ